MRLTTLAIIGLLMAGLLIAKPSNPSSLQKPPGKYADLEKLEAQFKEIDKQYGPVRVEVTGNKESSGNLMISVVKRVDRLGETAAPIDAAPARDGSQEITVNIDLSAVNVPDQYINEKIAAAFSAENQNGMLPGVKVMQLGASGIYEVVENYIYDPGAYRITVWSGFKYDRASIPRIFWILIDKDSLSNVPPLFHDLLYRHGGVLPMNQVSPYRKFSRKDTDDLFFELMTKCGVKPWRRLAAYKAVRTFSAFAWNEAK